MVVALTKDIYCCSRPRKVSSSPSSFPRYVDCRATSLCCSYTPYQEFKHARNELDGKHLMTLPSGSSEFWFSICRHLTNYCVSGPLSVNDLTTSTQQSKLRVAYQVHGLHESVTWLDKHQERESIPLFMTYFKLARVYFPPHSSPRMSTDLWTFMGVPGAYSEAAACTAYPNCEAVPCKQFENAFQAVELWLVDRAVLPIENSLGGSIHRNYDLLLRHHLHIVGEVQFPVYHCLLGLPGIKKEDLRRVLSHAQALAQCEHTLSELGVTREAVDDTAGAAQYISENNFRDTGAVASARAAEIYGLDILAEGIQDDTDNITRFLILAREPIIPRYDRSYKTSVVFTLEEGPGILFKALSVFALREINLTKIESRPQRKKPLRIVDDNNTGCAKFFDYLFYIDFQVSMADPRAQKALGHLQEFAPFIRVLGSYPMDTGSA